MSVPATNAVWEHSQTVGTARLVMALIADSANAAGWHSFDLQEEIARKANTSVRAVERAIKSAIAMGELEVHRPDRSGRNQYSVMLPGLAIFEDEEERRRRDEHYGNLAAGRAERTRQNRANRHANRRSEDPTPASGPSPEGPDTSVGSDPTPASGGDPTPASGLKGNNNLNTKETTASPDSVGTEQEGIPEILCEEFGQLLEADGVHVHDAQSVEWRTAARLMITRDGRTVDEVVAVMRWTRRDDFWRANVLSMPKLRKQFDQLRLKAERDPDFRSANVVSIAIAGLEQLTEARRTELHEEFREHISEDVVESWVAQTWQAVDSADLLVIGGDSRTISWLELRYGRLINDVATQLLSFSGSRFVVAANPFPVDPDAQENAA